MKEEPSFQRVKMNGESSENKESSVNEEASVFRFKRFEVVNRRSAMKVNTDGVLLGAAMTITGKEQRLLDIGTGTGAIALMAAQRLSDARTGTCSGEDARPFSITGIDIDTDSAAEAAENFSRSPWSRCLEAINVSLDSFVPVHDLSSAAQGSATDGLDGENGTFDLIFSNPPYYSGDLKAPDERRCNARHSGSLSWAEIADFAASYLKKDGRLSLILPADQRNAVTRYAASEGLYLSRAIMIRTVPRKIPKRAILEFTRTLTRNPLEDSLSIQEAGTWTPMYRSLLSEFLINL